MTEIQKWWICRFHWFLVSVLEAGRCYKDDVYLILLWSNICKKIFIVIWNCFHCHLVNMSITLSKILARLYSLLSSHPAHYTATEYGSVFKTFFLAQITVPRSERLIFHNVNACSDNFWMRNLFLSSSSSNPPLTPSWQIINNWDQLKLKKITVIVLTERACMLCRRAEKNRKEITSDCVVLC